MNISEVVYQETEILQKLVPFDRIGDVAASLCRIEAAVNKRIAELEGALEDIAVYATTESLVTEIISAVLNKEEK